MSAMALGKVICFITLLLKHPYAGNQIPAGTVEEGESFVAAALSDHHKFVLRWSPLTEDPGLQEPFAEWFDSVKGSLVD